MSTSKIERLDDIPLIFHWLMKVWVAELIDRIWPPHGNWKGLTYGQLAVLFITYVVHSLNHRLSGMEAWLVSHQRLLEQLVGWGEERTPTFQGGGLRWGSFVTPTYGLSLQDYLDMIGHRLVPVKHIQPSLLLMPDIIGKFQAPASPIGG